MEPDLNLIRLQQLLKPFENTGITNTSVGLPFRSMVDMQETANQDLVQQIIAENATKVSPVMYDEFPQGFSFRPQGLSQQFKFLPEAYNQSEDVEQVDSLTGEKKFNVLDLLGNFIPGKGIGSFLARILPKDPPEVRRVKDVYAEGILKNNKGGGIGGLFRNFALGSNASTRCRIVKYEFTGGKYGEPMQVGLEDAARSEEYKI
jgi:hypothetical protein